MCNILSNAPPLPQGPPGQKGDQGATEIIDYNGNIQEALQVRRSLCSSADASCCHFNTAARKKTVSSTNPSCDKSQLFTTKGSFLFDSSLASFPSSGRLQKITTVTVTVIKLCVLCDSSLSSHGPNPSPHLGVCCLVVRSVAPHPF